MLQSIRDYTHGWIAGTIISLLILSFGLWGIHTYLTSFSSSNTVAKVNGVEITKSQLDMSYERLRRQLQTQYSANFQLPEHEEANLKQRALQTLIESQALKQASEKGNYRITEDQIESFLQSIPEFQVNGEFSLSRFQQVLATTLFSDGEFVDVLKSTMLIDQPRLGISFTSFALPNEVTDTIALVGQERNLQYFSIPQEYFAKQPINISNEEISAYYNQHQDDFKTPEQVSIEYISLSVKDIASTIHPADSVLKSFYNENSNMFTTPLQLQLDELVLPLAVNATQDEIKQAETKMDEVVKSAKSGESFDALIKKYSLNKGDEKLKNWEPLDQVPSDLQKAASALNKSGSVSEPVRTSKGLVLLKLIGYKDANVQSYDAIKDKVKDVYVRQQAEERFGDVREKLAGLTYEHPDSLSTAAKELGLTVQTSGLFTKEKGGSDITANAKIREAAFSNDVLTLQNNSDVIQITPESALVLRVKSHVPASLLSLDAVKNQITGKLRSSAIEEKTKQLADEITTDLQSGKLTIDQVKTKYNFSLNNVGFIGRHSNKIDQSILDTTFAMPKPHDNKITFASTKITNGYAVISLSAIKDGGAQGSKEQYEAFAEQIQEAQGNLEYELYKQSLMNHSKISLEN